MYRVSVDVGGTFTDLIALNEETGELTNIKISSTPKNLEKGVNNAFKQLLEEIIPEEISMVGHATTIATNALFGQINLKIPQVGFITTKGFRDIIEIGRQRRAEVYNLFFERPPTLSERRYRYEVNERIDSEGQIIKPINKEDVSEALDSLIHKGICSIAVGFLNSYANSIHEETVREVAEKKRIKAYLTLSSRSSNEYREYERFSTALVDAALMPVIHSYINSLQNDLVSHEIKAPLYIMQSNGGLASVENVSRHPARIIESGPASGVIAAAWLGALVGEKNIISFDMGGTTAKTGAVRDLIPEIIPEYEVAGKIHLGRLVKGSGYPVRFPFIDLAECSAGGGTIAWEKSGILHVGPLSAGAYPGPACYERGGNVPTITDANLILGRLNQEELLNGEMKIAPKLSHIVIEELAKKVNLGIEETAYSIIRISNSIMSKILRIVSIERGFDPRNFTLVAFGGAGPMHICALAEELKITKIIIPPNPGMFSALGLLTADLFHDYTQALVEEIRHLDPDKIDSIYQTMKHKGLETLLAEGVKRENMSFRRQLDLRYLGQAYELAVDTINPFTNDALNEVIVSFHKRHEEIYGYSSKSEPIELVNIRLRAIGHIDKPKLKRKKMIEGKTSPKDYRDVFFEDLNDWIQTPVYDRKAIQGETKGPSIIEQYDSTTVVYSNWIIEPDTYGNLVLRRKFYD